ncbi:ABC transporter family protein [Tritrichomonas foetus]|uniref:ABC transporter family protein n=1 Tax=Tritrichomonas foetus TaxID=1144522 RepID=A0A1J4JFV1_9EUKA|nr:ABC transporter family protein [Tritrichomonas foetus]|eukprot:OHS98000.1 ABC transporter family protein [Tritrichomonas foetus]
MPPMGFLSAFKQQGSLDDFEGKRGNEYFRIMKYFNNKFLLVITYLVSGVSGVMPLLMNVFIGDMVNSFNTTSGSMLDSLTSVIMNMIYFNVAFLVVQTIGFILRTTTNPYFMRDLRFAIYKSYLNQDIDYFDKVPTGAMIGRISQDITMIHEILIDKICTTIQNMAQAIGGIILALVTVWECGLIGIGVTIVVSIVFIVGEKLVDKIWFRYNEGSSQAATKAEEVMTSFRTIKSFDCELKESEKYQETLSDVDQVFKITSLIQGGKEGIITLMLTCMQAGVLYYASYLIIRKPEKNYLSGDLFVILMSLTFSTLGMSSAMTIADDVKRTLVSCAKVLDVIERVPKTNRKEGNKLDSIKGKIEFRDVTFKYSTAKNNAVEHLSFTINPGETVALVGESGCGKSTTLQLLQRFYEIDSGEILIDGVNIKTLAQTYIRSQISIVPQSPILFTMSIEENIAYGIHRKKRKHQAIAEAATVGNAHNFIMEIPQNYKARVQQTSLSGGQKQRICISRAILYNTPILLLDEATAALDTESERLVQQSLEQFRKGKTAIMVAHRLATVINADRILVFKDGHIEEEGTHSDLLEKNGIYADLVKYQLQ